jgi:uncharacterized membrane protein
VSESGSASDLGDVPIPQPKTLENKVNVVLEPLVPPDKLPEATESVTQVLAKFMSGPIPPAEFAKEWAELYPDAPKLLFQMAFREQKHRHNENVRDFIYGIFGQSTGLIFSLAALIAGAYAIDEGHDIAGVGLGATAIGGVVAQFIRGNKVFSSGDEPSPPKKRPTAAHAQVAVAARKRARKRRGG